MAHNSDLAEAVSILLTKAFAASAAATVVRAMAGWCFHVLQAALAATLCAASKLSCSELACSDQHGLLQTEALAAWLAGFLRGEMCRGVSQTGISKLLQGCIP